MLFLNESLHGEMSFELLEVAHKLFFFMKNIIQIISKIFWNDYNKL